MASAMAELFKNKPKKKREKKDKISEYQSHQTYLKKKSELPEDFHKQMSEKP